MSAKIRLTNQLVRSCKPSSSEYSLQDSGIRGLALRVRPTGGKSWLLRFRRDGRAWRVALGDAADVPVEHARQSAHSILSGKAPASEEARPSAMSLKKFSALYVERRSKEWRPQTRRTQRSYLSNQLVPALGKRPLDRIGTSEVAAWFHTYSRARPGGANRAIAVLSDLITRAIEWGVLPKDHANPCFAIRRNRTRERGQMLNQEALARLGAALQKYALVRPDAVDAIRLLLLTGARPGEICGLQWSEVESERIVLAQAKRGPRSVPLGKAAAQILGVRRKHHEAARFVFPHRTLPDRPLPLPRYTWSTIKREAQLPQNLRLHDLRHNFASHTLLAGESLLVAGSLLGHSRPAMTARYAHLADDSLLEAAQRVASVIAKMVTREKLYTARRTPASPPAPAADLSVHRLRPAFPTTD